MAGMSRAARLLDLIEALRRHRRPVRGVDLAGDLGISLRTLYRDIATLQGQGVPVEGEAGLGYVLRPGLTLPPLNFDIDEIDAMVLGLRLVARRLPKTLGRDAESALAKIEAVLPKGRSIDDVQLLVGSPAGETGPVLETIRRGIRDEAALAIDYRDKNGAPSRRVVWPVLVGFFDQVEVLAAWCELRAGFRYFRLDRIAAIEPAGRGIGRRHRILLADWKIYRDQEEAKGEKGPSPFPSTPANAPDRS
ncbi:Predicted DNA-binding transcriptional regulator YafY, contains an HTH and WYL domains [Fulvimarina manganoxydans]|uniref:Predicted DNA-binding transcriptional regulator YafY, contains an HTH and WYL domains n=1 Tax=Fulvimarina manganoxydans TaxID=937218 RepID=A0A1W1YME1_9HYPH|nr:YafY family protein [Fulvimarina manganoxydans]SMC37375.1 Predicted DNA-binding transcriptional regulator YafY, contains an HTH and WYL domains [Fulvimarina manganoxydans]